jgi:hypothetical protein
MEALAAVLEIEGSILKHLAEEGDLLIDPLALQRNRTKREKQVELFRRLNERSHGNGLSTRDCRDVES